MNPAAPRSQMLILHPAFVLGGLLALYFLLGRWTFARLQGDYDEVPYLVQPRVWAIAMIALLAALTFCALRDRGISSWKPIDVTIIAWIGYMLITWLWAPDPKLAADKGIEMLMLLTVAVSIAVTRSPATEGWAMLGFWYGLVAIGAAMGLLALYMSSGGRVFTPTGGPNIFGRNMGLVGVGALLLATRHFAIQRIGLYVIVVLSAMWVVMCGSRGALLATGVAGMVLLATARARLSTKIAAVAAFAVAAIAAFFCTEVGRNAVDVFRHRILQQTVEQRYTSSRDSLFSDAIQLGLEQPVAGCGLAGFRANSWTYPHNIFLEAFAEGGAIGVLLLLLVFWTWWQSLQHCRQAKTGTTLAAVALITTAASFSGNFYDSRGVFILLALTVDSLPFSGSFLARRPILSTQRLLAQVADRPGCSV